jgi:hypothetical protein
MLSKHRFYVKIINRIFFMLDIKEVK